MRLEFDHQSRMQTYNQLYQYITTKRETLNKDNAQMKHVIENELVIYHRTHGI